MNIDGKSKYLYTIICTVKKVTILNVNEVLV